MFRTACRELLDASWEALPDCLRRVHATGRASGRARVLAAETGLLRFLARILGFPRPAESVPVTLEVEPRGGYELWHRRFGSDRLTTRVAARRGLFAERFRGVEVSLAIDGSARGLVFLQRSAAAVWGPLRVPLPGVVAPRVEAHDRPGPEPETVEFWVRITLFGRRLVEYGGRLGGPP